MPKLKPLRSDVLIHPFDKPSKIGSLYMADQEHKRDRSKNGIVIGLGPDCSDDLEIGDHVLFNGYSGNKVAIEKSGIFLLIPEELIIAKVENSNVRLMDSETVKRIIEERIGEIQMKDPSLYLTDLRNTLFDRIDSFTQVEGMEF